MAKAITTGVQAMKLIAPLSYFFLYDRAQKTVDDGPDQRQEDDPAKIVCLYRMIHLTPYPFTLPLFRFWKFDFELTVEQSFSLNLKP